MDEGLRFLLLLLPANDSKTKGQPAKTSKYTEVITEREIFLTPHQ
jgi:hypothetical protein